VLEPASIREIAPPAWRYVRGRTAPTARAITSPPSHTTDYGPYPKSKTVAAVPSRIGAHGRDSLKANQNNSIVVKILPSIGNKRGPRPRRENRNSVTCAALQRFRLGHFGSWFSPQIIARTFRFFHQPGAALRLVAMPNPLHHHFHRTAVLRPCRVRTLGVAPAVIPPCWSASAFWLWRCTIAKSL